MATTCCIPMIDMQKFPGESGKLVAACEEWGCFRIINHGIPATMLSEMQFISRSLLDLPVETKRLYGEAVGGKGYSPPLEASPLLEGLDVYDMASPGAVNALCSHLHVSPHQRETIMKYTAAIHELAMTLGSRLGESMGFCSDLFKGWPCRFRLNKYHFSPQTVGSTGAPMHSDAGFLTVVHDDEIVNGLEAVDKKTGVLFPIDPMPGTLLVNVGDLAKAWSNGRFCNVKHRVQCNEGTIRTSMACFVLGPKEEKVEAPPQLVDSDHPRLFIPFTFQEYINLRISTRSPTGEALQLLQTASS
ncbi:2-oxoglutarate-dependent dioxygenase DAO-like [Cornus florida]|uniref:2-oxoglutarate-dependent dioxygenase DAO-like n=1 Tax=Cornus florida TaxID=4283 RepID=UPI0028965FA8|nr:2-oxoglutarate-dependent dioxygenase DAO-like [Cornus florida]